MDRNKFNSGFGFIDLLFNLLVGFVFLFFIAYILINPIAKSGLITPPDKVLITATWNKASNADVDIWMRDPTGVLLSFQNRIIPGSHLEKDDLGTTNDIVWINGERVISPINSETVHIQTLQPGTYAISVHMYNIRRENKPEEVTIIIRTLDPYRTIVEKQVVLSGQGQEIGVVEFTVGDKQNVIDVQDFDGGIIKQKIGSTYSTRRGWIP